RLVPHPSSEFEEYEPLLRVGTLFLMFANLRQRDESARQSIRKFADNYGDLTNPAVGKGAAGSTEEEWLAESTRLKQAFDLWEAARKGNLEQLNRLIVWDGSTNPWQEKASLVPGRRRGWEMLYSWFALP